MSGPFSSLDSTRELVGVRDDERRPSKDVIQFKASRGAGRLMLDAGQLPLHGRGIRKGQPSN